MRKFLLLFVTLLSIGLFATAEEVTVAIAANKFTADTGNSAIATYVSDGFTFTLDKDKSTNNNRFDDADHLRIYQNANFTVASNSGQTITKLSIIATGATYAKFEDIDTTIGIGSWSGTTFTWNGSATSVSFNASAQTRIKSITITYSTDSGSSTVVADLEVSPEFGNIEIGETITISCATEGATLSGFISISGSETMLENEALPYTYTVVADNLGKTITLGVWATKTGLTDSNIVDGTYTVVAPTPAEAVFQNGAGETVTGGEVPFGDYINFSWEAGCSAELYINNVLETEYDTASTSGSWYVSGEKYAVGDEVTLKVVVTNAYEVSSTATATFTVMSPYEIRDVVTISNLTMGSGYTNFSYLANGAEYSGRAQSSEGIYINKGTSSSSGSYGAAVFMTKSVGKVDKVIINVNSFSSQKGANIYVYGQNTPYTAYEKGTDKPNASLAYMYTGSNLGTKIGGAITTTGVHTIEDPGYSYIMIVSDGGVSFNSLTFVWNDPYVNASDVTYTMEGNVSNLTAGKFITLIDTTNGKSVSRNAAADGTIAGANAAIASVDGKMTLDLKKGQNSIDEFELVSATDGFKLLGGVLINRRYLAYDDANGLYTTTDADKAATVTFEVDGANLVVKFADGEYLVSDGTNFGKGAISDVAPMSLDDSATKVPAYVFVAPSNITTGVDEVEVADDATAPVRYYNLNGVEVNADNLVPGIYIIRQGDKASKQLVR